MAEPQVFVVERFNWQPYDSSPIRWLLDAQAHGTYARLAGSNRVATFADQASVQEDCQRREREARGSANPFAFGGPALHYQTSFDEGRLCDWLLDAGLSPPAPGAEGGWRGWWDAHAPNMTEVQKAKVWEALDKVRFFRVSEGSARVVFMVASVFWDFNDEFHYQSPDGLTPRTAYTTREKAEAACKKLEQAERKQYNPFEMNGHGPWSIWSSLSEEEALARLDQLGVRRPLPKTYAPDELNWEDWWYGLRTITQAKKQAIWDMFDKISFYKVLEVEMPA